MKLIRIIALTILTLSYSGSVHSQMHKEPKDLHVITYKTYADYENGKGDTLGMFKEFKVWGNLPKTLKIVVQNDSIVNTVQLANHWGFYVGSDLYRVMEYAYPYYVYDLGKLIYYEDGLAQLKLYTEYGTIFEVKSSYSDGLNGKLLVPKKMVKLKKKNEELTEMCNCVDEVIRAANSKQNVSDYRQKVHDVSRK